jgi:hypothetical protein
MDLVSRTRQTSRFNYRKLPYSPLKLDCKSDQDPTWMEVIIELLKHGHIWEANTLLAIRLRHENPMGSDLLRILDAVPDENDTMYDLVRLTMLVLCSRSLLRQKSIGDIPTELAFRTHEVYNRCKVCAQKLHASAMDCITEPMSSSRAYQEVRLLHLRLGLLSPPNDETPGFFGETLEKIDVIERARGNGDHMLSLASHEQFGGSLPAQWLRDTGASREAMVHLHPQAKLPEITLLKRDDLGDPFSFAFDRSQNVRSFQLAEKLKALPKKVKTSRDDRVAFKAPADDSTTSSRKSG